MLNPYTYFSTMMDGINVFWFRKDLRLEDNTGLIEALKSGKNVQCIFIYDKSYFGNNVRRKSFIYERLNLINDKLNEFGAYLEVLEGDFFSKFKELNQKWAISSIFYNKVYDKEVLSVENSVRKFCSQNYIKVNDFKDDLIFEPKEIVKDDRTPYAVYTAFKNKWLYKLSKLEFKNADINELASSFRKSEPKKRNDLKLSETKHLVKPYDLSDKIKTNYANDRDFPARQATSNLSVHLRFGTVSIRNIVKQVYNSEVLLSEIIWREFFTSIYYHFPLNKSESFKKQYDNIQWLNSKKEFEMWCNGQTGYSLVDAGMHELNETGAMHNRVRMVVASFLVKHLLIDWRWGEAYFADKLTDYDQAINNGNWQWVAGCGCDAAPYFRVFNPILQAKKFDPENIYVNKWNAGNTSKPIIEHKFARERCLHTFKQALK